MDDEWCRERQVFREGDAGGEGALHPISARIGAHRALQDHLNVVGLDLEEGGNMPEPRHSPLSGLEQAQEPDHYGERP